MESGGECGLASHSGLKGCGREWSRVANAGVMEARTPLERVERKVETSAFWYTQPRSAQPFRVNKKPGEDVPSVNLGLFLSGL